VEIPGQVSAEIDSLGSPAARGLRRVGIEAEYALNELGYKVALGSKISERSPFALWRLKIKVHSRTKMDIFYLMLFAALLTVAFSLGFAIRPQPASTTAPTASVGVLPAGVTGKK
jgi:hypothetical protein